MVVARPLGDSTAVIGGWLGNGSELTSVDRLRSVGRKGSESLRGEASWSALEPTPKDAWRRGGFEGGGLTSGWRGDGSGYSNSCRESHAPPW